MLFNLIHRFVFDVFWVFRLQDWREALRRVEDIDTGGSPALMYEITEKI